MQNVVKTPLKRDKINLFGLVFYRLNEYEGDVKLNNQSRLFLHVRNSRNSIARGSEYHNRIAA